MENVVPVEELGDFVEQTIAQIREGVDRARRAGVIADLPEQVEFTVTVVRKWQSLEAETVQTTENAEEQGGGSKETVSGTDLSKQTGRSEEDRTSTQTSETKSDQKTTDTNSGGVTETSEGEEGGSQRVDRDFSSEDQNQQENAHNQQTSTNYTYG